MKTAFLLTSIALALSIAPVLGSACATEHKVEAKNKVVVVTHVRRPAVIVFTRASDPNLQAEADLLREAYVSLSLADHDYKGHRHDAMHQTAHAAHLLGIQLEGDGVGEAPQNSSDECLREARGHLEQARSFLAAKGRHRIIQHVDHALHQIDVALHVA